MSTITKEWLQSQISAIKAVGITDSNTLLAFEIALASLEAEAVGEVVLGEYDDCGCHPDAKVVCIAADGQADWGNFKDGTPLYAAPPAPANAEPVAWLWSHRKHPSEVTLVRPEDDEMAEPGLWSGWSCQALYAAPPAPVSMKDHQIRELVNELRDIAVEYHGTQQLRERIARTVRAAMLQGAEPVTTAYKLPANTPCKDAPEHIWLQTAGVWPGNGEFSELTWCSDNQHQDDTLYVRADVVAGNSPVIPDGWTCNDKANAALMMLDRIETVDPVDDDRIDGIKRIVRELAAAPHDTPALNSVQSVDSVADRWIPVSERMPNDKDFVWCWGYVSGWTESDGFEAYYDATRNKWWTIDDETVRKVTHWMPLPAAPLWE